MKIIIIKLGAKGDVVRTLPILAGIKEKYPDSEIDWITKKESEDILKKISDIRKLYTLPEEPHESYNILYNLDIEKQATDLSEKIKADKKLGFKSDGDYVSTFNLGAEYYLNTLFDDELKRTNKKTYQEMMFQAAELDYKKQFYPIILNKKDKEYGEDFIKKNNINKEKLIGIHMGASSRWPSKVWHEEKVKDFIIKAKNKGYEILLFGGPNESEKHEKFSEDLEKHRIKIFRNNPNNSDIEFMSLVNQCEKMICSDSFSLHISLALKKPTIGLFFCTTPDEIEDYGLLKKLISPMLYEFFPEKMDQYSEELTKSISAEDVLKTLNNI